MRVPITYIASSGHRYDLVSNGIRHKNADYHRWGYGVRGTKLQYGVRVADFESLRTIKIYRALKRMYRGHTPSNSLRTIKIYRALKL